MQFISKFITKKNVTWSNSTLLLQAIVIGIFSLIHMQDGMTLDGVTKENKALLEKTKTLEGQLIEMRDLEARWQSMQDQQAAFALQLDKCVAMTETLRKKELIK